MDDLQIRRFYLVYFFCVSLTIFFFTGHRAVLILRIFLSILLSYTLLPLMNFISSIYTSLIYGPDYSNPSYESQFYQDDMEKAQRLLREEKWNKTISAYREII